MQCLHPPLRLGLSPGFRLDPVELLLLLFLPQGQGFLRLELGRGFRPFVAVPVLGMDAIWVHIHLRDEVWRGWDGRGELCLRVLAIRVTRKEGGTIIHI